MSEDKKTSPTIVKGEIVINIKQKEWIKKLEAASGKPVEFNRPQGVAYLVIDCSESMRGDNLEYAKNGSRGFAEEAQKKGYLVGLIQFGSEPKHLLDPQRDIVNFHSDVERLKIDGSTNMAAAILMAKDRLGNGKERVICLVTDGEPDDRKATLIAAKEAKSMGIDIMTIGTDDADKTFLEELATRKELSLKIVRTQLQQGITSMAKMLSGKT